MAMSNGDTPTVIVLETMFVRVSMTETVPVTLTTYTALSSGLTATRMGPIPTDGEAITLRFTMSITETLAEPPLAT